MHDERKIFFHRNVCFMQSCRRQQRPRTVSAPRRGGPWMQSFRQSRQSKRQPMTRRTLIDQRWDDIFVCDTFLKLFISRFRSRFPTSFSVAAFPQSRTSRKSSATWWRWVQLCNDCLRQKMLFRKLFQMKLKANRKSSTLPSFFEFRKYFLNSRFHFFRFQFSQSTSRRTAQFLWVFKPLFGNALKIEIPEPTTTTTEASK